MTIYTVVKRISKQIVASFSFVNVHDAECWEIDDKNGNKKLNRYAKYEIIASQSQFDRE